MKTDDLVTPKNVTEISDLLRKGLQSDFDLQLGNMELAPLSKRLILAIGARFFNAGLDAALQTVRRRAADLEDDIQCQEITLP